MPPTSKERLIAARLYTAPIDTCSDTPAPLIVTRAAQPLWNRRSGGGTGNGGALVAYGRMRPLS